MKSKLSLLLLGLIVLSLPSIALANNLTDLDTGSKYYKAISSFITEGVVKGYDDNTFKPENNVSRAEALKIIVEGFNLSNEAQSEITFPDVSEDEWFAKYVAIGLNLEIVKGYDDGQFKPGNNVRMAEALKMALVAKGVNIGELSFEEFHPRVSSSDWFGPMFSYAFNNNLIDLENDGSLDPGKVLTRAELVDLAYRVKSKPINDKLDLAFNWVSTNDNELIDLKYPIEWQANRFGDNGLVVNSSNEEGVKAFIQSENELIILLEVIEIDSNLESNDYFLEVKTNLGDGWDYFEEGKRSGKYMIAKKESDLLFYYWVENGKAITGETNIGESFRSVELEKIARKVFSSTDLKDGAVFSSSEEMLDTLRDFLLVSNKGKETINGFDRSEIIETDNIGVGTGPVDYYYLPSIDYTAKYERAEDIILDIVKGKTTNF